MEVSVKRDGLTLRGILDVPSKDSYDIAILFHGFTSDLGYNKDQLLYQVSKKLVDHGIATIRFDFNGHGKSDGRFEDMTVLNEIADGKAILDYTKNLPNIKKIFLVGHSQGGVVASMLAGYYPDIIDRVVLMAPAATLKDDALKGDTQGYTYDPKHIPDRLSIKKNLTLGGFYLRTAQLLPIYETARMFLKPVTLIHGDSDDVVNKIASLRYDEVYKNSTLKIISGADHGFNNESRDEAIEIVVSALTNKD